MTAERLAERHRWHVLVGARPGPATTASPSTRSSTRRAIGPLLPDRLQQATDRREVASQRHLPGRRLEPGDPTEVRRQPHLPAMSLPTPSGEPPAAMIAASPPLDPPGVRAGRTGCSSARRRGCRSRTPAPSPAGSSCRGRSHRPRAAAPRPSHPRWAPPGPPERPAGTGHAGYVQVVLDGDGHSVQPPDRAGPALASVASAARAAANAPVEIEVHHRVQRRVDGLDPPQMGLDNLSTEDTSRGHGSARASAAAELKTTSSTRRPPEATAEGAGEYIQCTPGRQRGPRRVSEDRKLTSGATASDSDR